MGRSFPADLHIELLGCRLGQLGGQLPRPGLDADDLVQSRGLNGVRDDVLPAEQ